MRPRHKDELLERCAEKDFFFILSSTMIVLFSQERAYEMVFGLPSLHPPTRKANMLSSVADRDQTNYTRLGKRMALPQCVELFQNDFRPLYHLCFRLFDQPSPERPKTIIFFTYTAYNEIHRKSFFWRDEVLMLLPQIRILGQH